MKRKNIAPSFATLVQDFFGQRLVQQQNASHCTVASYRDTFRLLLGFFQKQRRKASTSLTLADIDAPTILAFLNDLEKQRGNVPRTRNLRLAALRSFVRYAAAGIRATWPMRSASWPFRANASTNRCWIT